MLTSRTPQPAAGSLVRRPFKVKDPTSGSSQPLDVQDDDTIGKLCRKIQESLRIQDAIIVHVHGCGQLSPDAVILEKFPTGGITFNVSIDNSTRSKKATKSMKLVESGPNGDTVYLGPHKATVSENEADNAEQDNEISGMKESARATESDVSRNKASNGAKQSNKISW